jgi:peptide deformylase
MLKLIMVLDILQIGDEHLTRASEPVTDFASPKLKQLIADMIETCEADREHTAGLAAPQVGHNIRLTVVGRVQKDPETGERKTIWKALINPKITKVYGDKDSLLWEACLSIGTGAKQLWGPVWRPDKVKVEYQDETGAKQTITGEGFFSHLLQHELDHLDGILFISRVENPEQNLWPSSKLDKYLEENKHYPEPV